MQKFKSRKFLFLFVFICLIILTAKPVWATEADCSAKGEGYGCRDRSSCVSNTIITGLCPGGADNVCCKAAEIGGVAGGATITCKSGTTVECPGITGQGIFSSLDLCRCCGDCQLNDFLVLGVNIAKIVLQWAGVALLVVFIIGGIMWMTSGGASEKVAAGKKWITNGIVGLIIIVFAFVGVRWIEGALGVKEEYLIKPEVKTETLGIKSCCYNLEGQTKEGLTKSECEKKGWAWLAQLCGGLKGCCYWYDEDGTFRSYEDMLKSNCEKDPSRKFAYVSTCSLISQKGCCYKTDYSDYQDNVSPAGCQLGKWESKTCDQVIPKGCCVKRDTGEQTKNISNRDCDRAYGNLASWKQGSCSTLEGCCYKPDYSDYKSDVLEKDCSLGWNWDESDENCTKIPKGCCDWIKEDGTKKQYENMTARDCKKKCSDTVENDSCVPYGGNCQP